MSLTVRPAERATLLADPAQAAIHDALAAAKKYVEGYALRFEVTDRATLAPLAQVLERLIALRA